MNFFSAAVFGFLTVFDADGLNFDGLEAGGRPDRR